jgi:ATP-dependent Clp protease ATP-binding subunit ClpC
MTTSTIVEQIRTLANAYAIEKRHEYIGTEHLLVALLRTNDPATLRILAARNIDPAAIIEAVGKLIVEGPDTVSESRKPITPRTKATLQHAEEERQHTGGDAEGVHFLLALLREHESVAAQVLRKSGLTLDLVRIMLATESEKSDAVTAPAPEA